MIVVPIFNRKIISTFDSRAAGAGMSIAMLLDNYYKFDLISEARWIPKDSSSQSKMIQELKYAFNDDPMLNKTLSTLYKTMPELNSDFHDTWKQAWSSARIAVEINVNSRLCAEESEYFVELKYLADGRANARKIRKTDKKNGDNLDNIEEIQSKIKANNTYAREPETPKLAAVPSLLVYGVDSRLNYLAKAKTSRISSSGFFFQP